MRVPDRVPVSTGFSYFPQKYLGVKAKDAYYDYPKWKEALLKTIVDFAPDTFRQVGNDSGKSMEMMDSKQTVWPGHGVPDTAAHQFVEGEYMKADEYQMFLHDRTDFIIRKYFPRVYGTLEPLEKMPSFGDSLGMLPMNLFATDEFAKMFETLVAASRESMEWRAQSAGFAKEVADLGFPSYGMYGGNAPFDVLSDRFRGMRGTMLDMYRNPDELLEACEILLPLQSRMFPMMKEMAKNSPSEHDPIVFIALHRGADGFMSIPQFERFYWPTLKKHVDNVVAAGLVPCIFFEGDYTSKLEYLLELPKAKILAQFDSTDIKRAKDVLKGHMCIMGNVPSSLLQTGNPEDVKAYCKDLIDYVGKDGGFIMHPRSAIDEVKPENLKMMFDFTKEYGKY